MARLLAAARVAWPSARTRRAAGRPRGPFPSSTNLRSSASHRTAEGGEQVASWGKHVLHIIRAFHSNASALYAAGWAAVPHVPRRLPRPPHVPRLPRVSPLRAAVDRQLGPAPTGPAPASLLSVRRKSSHFILVPTAPRRSQASMMRAAMPASADLPQVRGS